MNLGARRNLEELVNWAVDVWLSVTPHWTALSALGLIPAYLLYGAWIALPLLALSGGGAALILRSRSRYLRRNGAVDPMLRITTFNVLRTNQNPDAISNVVGALRPDVLVLQEWSADSKQNVGSVRDEYRYCLRTDPEWVVVLSRFPLEESRVIAVADAPGRRAVLSVRIRVNSTPVAIFALHAIGPDRWGRLATQTRQLKTVQSLVEQADCDAVVVIGDLNATVLSPPLAQFLDASGLRSASGGWPPSPTWPTWARALGIHIDHVLVRGMLVGQVTVGPAAGSDHRAMTADLAINPIADGCSAAEKFAETSVSDGTS